MQNKAKGQKRGKMIKRGVDDDRGVACGDDDGQGGWLGAGWEGEGGEGRWDCGILTFTKHLGPGAEHFDGKPSLLCCDADADMAMVLVMMLVMMLVMVLVMMLSMKPLALQGRQADIWSPSTLNMHGTDTAPLWRTLNGLNGHRDHHDHLEDWFPSLSI